MRPILTRETSCSHDATRAYEAVQGLSDLFSIRLQNDDVQDFDVRRDQALLSASDMLSDVILEGLYKSKLQDSVQLQTVLALYDQESVRNNGQTSFLHFSGFGFGIFYGSGNEVEETQYLHSLPEKPKLRRLLENKKNERLLQKTHHEQKSLVT